MNAKNSQTNDPFLLTSLDAVRGVVGESNPMTAQKVHDALDEQARAFVASSPFALLATVDAAGCPDVSPKGDSAGFVHCADDRTLLVPDRKGNRLIFGLQNILENPQVALIFLVPGTEETLRVQGVAELTVDPDVLMQLQERGQPALLAIRVRVRSCYFHCAKAFRRSSLWRPDTWPERIRVSFGRQFARKLGGDDQMAEEIDRRIEASYETEL